MEYPWFGEYDLCGMPRTLEPYPGYPSHGFLDYAAGRFPRLVFVQSGLEIPYPEVKEHSDRLASALSELGVRKGDRVATLLPTSVQFVVADAGISKAGAVHVPCSFLESSESVARKLLESGTHTLICLDDHSLHAGYLKENAGVGLLISSNLMDYSGATPRGAGIPGALRLVDLIDQASPAPPDMTFDTASDLEAVIFTGGTTGVSKGCMLTHRNVVANAVQNPVIFGPVTGMFKGSMAVLMGNPFFHSYGHSVMHTMIHCCFSLLLLVDPRDYRSMLSMINSYHPVLQTGVPTQFMNMLKEDARKATVVGISGSAPLPPSVQQKFKEAGTGRYVVEGYGLSELTAVSHCNVSATISAMGGRKMMRFLYRTLLSHAGVAVMRLVARVIGPRLFARQFIGIAAAIRKFQSRFGRRDDAERLATIGVPLPDTEVRVIDFETGEPFSWSDLIEKEATGEMLLRGPQRMLGYWPEPGSGMDEEGFVHTGDIVKMDRKGYFAIVDRAKDMVIVSGYKVYTREIDDQLYSHPATEHAAAIGVPDPERPGSERVVVFVQLREGFKGSVTEDEFMDYLKDRTARYAVPRAVIFLDEIPLTEVFKVNKKALRDIAGRYTST